MPVITSDDKCYYTISYKAMSREIYPYFMFFCIYFFTSIDYVNIYSYSYPHFLALFTTIYTYFISLHIGSKDDILNGIEK